LKCGAAGGIQPIGWVIIATALMAAVVGTGTLAYVTLRGEAAKVKQIVQDVFSAICPRPPVVGDTYMPGGEVVKVSELQALLQLVENNPEEEKFMRLPTRQKHQQEKLHVARQQKQVLLSRALDESAVEAYDVAEFEAFLVDVGGSTRNMIALGEFIKGLAEKKRDIAKQIEIDADLVCAQVEFTENKSRALFDAFDFDDSGSLDIEELSNAVERISIANGDIGRNDVLSEAVELLSHMDADSNGEISFAEFHNALVDSADHAFVRTRLRVTRKALTSLLVEKDICKKNQADAEVKRAFQELEAVEASGSAEKIEQARQRHEDAKNRRLESLSRMMGTVDGNENATEGHRERRSRGSVATGISATQTALMNMAGTGVVVAAMGGPVEEEEAADGEEEVDDDDDEEEEEEEEEPEEIKNDPTADLIAQLKLLVTQMQIFGSMASTIQIDWPQVFLDVSSQAKALKIDFVAIFGIGCTVRMSYYSRLTLYFVLPFMGLAMIVVIFLVQRFVNTTSDVQELYDKAWNNVQTMLFLLYPNLAQVTLDAFNCREILGEYYLIADYEARCFTVTWSKYAVLAAIGLTTPHIASCMLSHHASRRKLFALTTTP